MGARNSSRSFRVAWLDGKMVKIRNARMSPFSPSAQYGCMPFEGIRFYRVKRSRAIFRLKEHVSRFFNSASAIGMVLPHSREDIEQGIKVLIAASDLEEGYIRPTGFFKEANVGLKQSKKETPSVAISLWRWESIFSNGIKIMTSGFIRPHPQSIFPGAKLSGHYVNSVLALNEARKKGFDDAVLCDFNGEIAECPGANVFVVKNRVVYTPDSESILRGITRDTIVEIVSWSGLRVEERALKPKFLRAADEVFLVGTAAEVTPVIEIDGKRVGGGSIGTVTCLIRDRYFKVVRGNETAYRHWLTFVDE